MGFDLALAFCNLMAWFALHFAIRIPLDKNYNK